MHDDIDKVKCTTNVLNPNKIVTAVINKLDLSLPVFLFIILDRLRPGLAALASRLLLFSFILSLMSSRLCWKDFF